MSSLHRPASGTQAHPAKFVRDGLKLWRCYPLGALWLLILALSVQTAHAQQLPGGNTIVTPPVNVTPNVTVQVPPMDPEAVGTASAQGFTAVVGTVVAPTLAHWANDLLDAPDIVRQTPSNWTYSNGTVQDLARGTLKIALALVGVALFAFGAMTALGQRPPAGQFVFGVILAIGNLSWWQMGILLNNALCASINTPTIRSIVGSHLEVPTVKAAATDVVPALVMTIAYALVVILLVISALFRLGMLDILISVGSLCLLCFALDGRVTNHFSGFYARMSLGTLFSQVLVNVALWLATALSGMGQNGVMASLLGIAILLTARRMPALLSSASSGGASPAVALAVARRVVGAFV